MPPTKEAVNAFARVRLSVCLSVGKITQKTRAWIWMKCCTSTDVGTWTNWLTFEPDPDALQREILLRGKSHVQVLGARHCSRGNNFVGGKCVPPNALPVCCVIVVGLCYLGKYFAASTDMSPSSARPVSTGTYVNFSVLDVHSTRCRRPHSSSHMSRHAWTTATLYWRARRKRRRPTNCNEC